MTDTLLSKVIETYGSLGVVLVVTGFALRWLHVQLTAVQEARIADAQLATTKLLELVAAQHAHMETLARAIDGNVDAIHDHTRMLERMASARPGPAVRLPIRAPRVGGDTLK